MSKKQLLLTPFVLLIALLMGACASTQTVSSQVNDVALVAKVKAKLVADPEINPFRINVDSNEGVIRLSGAVEKRSAKREAARLASRTEGVRRVINDLTIGDETIGQQIDDATLSGRVKARFAADPEIKARNIDVDAEEGVVILTGRVETKVEKEHAESLALATKGVWKVRNLLKIGSAKH